MIRTLAFPIIIFSTTILTGKEPPRFVGYADLGERSVFLLEDPISGERSRFVTIGDTFQGYGVSAFDVRKETLVIVKDGVSISLSLVDAKIRKGQASISREDEMNPENRVTVIGAVQEQGSLKPTAMTTVADAIAAMGGFRADAKVDSMTLARKNERGLVLRSVDGTKTAGMQTKVMPGDVISIRSVKDD